MSDSKLVYVETAEARSPCSSFSVASEVILPMFSKAPETEELGMEDATAAVPAATIFEASPDFSAVVT